MVTYFVFHFFTASAIDYVEAAAATTDLQRGLAERLDDFITHSVAEEGCSLYTEILRMHMNAPEYFCVSSFRKEVSLMYQPFYQCIPNAIQNCENKLRAGKTVPLHGRKRKQQQPCFFALWQETPTVSQSLSRNSCCSTILRSIQSFERRFCDSKKLWCAWSGTMHKQTYTK